MVFTSQRTVSTRQTKGFVVKINLHQAEKGFNAKSICKMGKNWFSPAKQPVFTSQDEGFVSKIHF